MKKAWLYTLLAITLLICSFLFAYPLWRPLDVGLFKLLNGSLDGRPLWQTFWAYANTRAADWIEDGVFVALFLWHILSAPKGARKERFGQMLYVALALYFVIQGINRGLLHEVFVIYRDSPNLTFNDAFMLSEHVPGVRFHEVSRKSFPADHATTAIFFTALFCTFANGRKRVLSIIYGVFLTLPRLFTGAHWLSDVIVGSGSITLFSYALFIYTPLYPIYRRLWSK